MLPSRSISTACLLVPVAAPSTILCMSNLPCCRFVPLTACQPGRGPPPQRTLHALLPPALLPPGSVPPLWPTGAAGADLEGGQCEPRPKPRGRWLAAVEEEEEEAAVEQRRRLVAAHPLLLLLLEHPGLQRCGACAACTGAAPPVPKGATRRRQGSRACLNRQRFVQDYQRQRRRAQQADEAAAAGGSSSGPAAPRRSARAAHPLAVPLSAGVPELAALRAAAAYKLLYPGWEPSFLTEQRIAEVAAALPAAVSALQRGGGGGGEHGSSEGSGGERRPQQRSGHGGPAKGQANFFQQKQHERMQRLLDQLRGVAEVGAGEAQGPAQQQGAHQRRQQPSPRAADGGSPSDLPLTQPCGTQLDSPLADGTQPCSGMPIGTQPAPSHPGNPAEASNASPSPAALGQPRQGQQGPQAQQQQGWVPGGPGSAFAPAASPAAGAAAASPQHAGQVAAGRALERALRQLPPDVQAAFRAGLSAGLPPGTVAAAVRRYQSITAAVGTAAGAAVGAPPGGSASGAQKRRRRASHESDGSSSGGLQEGPGTEEADAAGGEGQAPAQRRGHPLRKRGRQ